VCFVPAITSPSSKLPMDAILLLEDRGVSFEKNLSNKNNFEKYYFGIEPYRF
jgi:hypothetical protein